VAGESETLGLTIATLIMPSVNHQIKYADELKDISAKDFCEETGLSASYGTEFSKMRNLTTRLKLAGLNVAMI